MNWIVLPIFSGRFFEEEGIKIKGKCKFFIKRGGFLGIGGSKFCMCYGGRNVYTGATSKKKK